MIIRANSSFNPINLILLFGLQSIACSTVPFGKYQIAKDGVKMACIPLVGDDDPKSKKSVEAAQHIPRITSFSPRESNNKGGTQITIAGRGLSQETQVFFGDSPCIGVKMLSKESISCISSSHPSEIVDIVVVNPDQRCDILAQSFRFNQSIVISPKNVRISIQDKVQFLAGRGIPPYQFSIVNGKGDIDAKLGLFTAPNEVGATLVQVQDSGGGSDNAVVQIRPVLKSTLRQTKIPSLSSAYITLSGGVPPYQFSVASEFGEIDRVSGLFRAAAPTDDAKVVAVDALGREIEVHFKISEELKTVVKEVSAKSKAPLGAVGGTPPYVFSVISGAGTIDARSGVFTAPDQPGYVIIGIKDSEDNFSKLEMKVQAVPTILPNQIAISVGDIIPFRSVGGATPITYRVSVGNGQIDKNTGRYRASEISGDETIEARDAVGNYSEAKVKIGGFQTPHMISASMNHTCAIYQRTGKCWGDNVYGQLGEGSVQRSLQPVNVDGLQDNTLSIVTGFNHTCALVRGGAVKCWGDNSKGQLGIFSMSGAPVHQSSLPIQVAGLNSGVLAISAGEFHTCAMKDGGVFCWGDNSKGQLGSNRKGFVATPVRVQNIQSPKTITAGAYHSCALINGGVKCWGGNFDGQLGNHSWIDSDEPVQVEGLTQGVEAIDTKGNHTCALLSGHLMCWGYNANGQLGTNSTDNKNIPTPISGIEAYIDGLSVGYNHTCIRANSVPKVWCWGYNYYGQVGDVPGPNYLVPHPVSGLPEDIIAVASGVNHTCALLKDSVSCWGSNARGQFGNRTTKSSNRPSILVKID